MTSYLNSTSLLLLCISEAVFTFVFFCECGKCATQQVQTHWVFWISFWQLLKDAKDVNQQDVLIRMERVECSASTALSYWGQLQLKTGVQTWHQVYVYIFIWLHRIMLMLEEKCAVWCIYWWMPSFKPQLLKKNYLKCNSARYWPNHTQSACTHQCKTSQIEGKKKREYMLHWANQSPADKETDHRPPEEVNAEILMSCCVSGPVTRLPCSWSAAATSRIPGWMNVG